MQPFRIKRRQAAYKKIFISAVVVSFCMFSSATYADSLSQAKRMHDRLAGVPGSQATLNEMANLIDQGQIKEAAYIAMQAPSFYNVTIKNWVTPWTNEEADIFAPLNDYSATVIGMVRDDVDFRLILSGDIIYTAQGTPYSRLQQYQQPTLRSFRK